MIHFKLNKQREEEDQLDADLLKKVNHLIHKAFIKLGVAVALISIIVTLAVIFILPKAVSSFYYDPGKTVAEDTNQMSLDLAIYSELALPETFRSYVTTESNGYGNYEIMIPQQFSFGDTFSNVAGKIKRGKLTLYDVNVLRKPSVNVFGWNQTYGEVNDSLSDLLKEEKDNYVHGAAGTAKEATESLEQLMDHTNYVGYVTLDKRMKYEDFYQYVDKKVENCNAVWCAIATEPIVKKESCTLTNLGVRFTEQSSTSLEWDRDTYPELILGDAKIYEEHKEQEQIKNRAKEPFMKKHFLQQLEYISKQEAFLEMMDDNAIHYKDVADYIRENGLIVYGFVVVGEKNALQKLNAQDEVYQIYTQPLK